MTDDGDPLNSIDDDDDDDDDDVCELVVDDVQDDYPYLDDEFCGPYLDDCADSADRVLFPDANHDFVDEWCLCMILTILRIEWVQRTD